MYSMPIYIDMFTRTYIIAPKCAHPGTEELIVLQSRNAFLLFV